MKDTDPMNSTEDLVRAANPVATSDMPSGDSPAARRLLATLPVSAPARPGRRPALRVRVAAGGAAVAGLAAAAIAAVTVLSPAAPSGPGHPAAVTGNLRELVLAADKLPAAPALQPGQFQYTDSISLNEVDTIPARGHYFAVDYSQHRQIWIGADGSGRIAETSTSPVFPTPADLAHWAADGRPSLAKPPADDRYGRGQLSDGPGVDLNTLTTDPVKLAQLISSRKIEGGPAGPGEDFVQVGDLLREDSAPPALRAALFRVAAGIPGVRVVPNARDHSGRPGIALVREEKVSRGPGRGSLDRSELIFDRATSALLGESAGFVSPATGAVTYGSWTVYLKSFVTDSVTSVTPVSGG